MTLNIMKLQKKTIWVLKISNKKPLFHCNNFYIKIHGIS